MTDSGNEIPLLPPGHIRPRYQRLLSLAYKRLSDCCVWCCNLTDDVEDDFMPPLENNASPEEIQKRKKELYAMMFEKYILPPAPSEESLDDQLQTVQSHY